MTEDDCNGCGSSLFDRERYARGNPDDGFLTGLVDCPHCGADKCCMCDMGDDVPCLSCDNGCPND